MKKYPNRRLYDTEESRYVTLADVQQLVRRGINVKVIDSQSSKDITRGILIQIITEQETAGEPLFTTEMLVRFIRFYDEAVHEAFSGYLDQSLRFFADQQRDFNDRMRDVLGGRATWDITEMTRRNLEFWKGMQDQFFKAAVFPSPGHEARKDPAKPLEQSPPADSADGGAGAADKAKKKPK
ncbi:polyhydroxyalkonate synthesis repressor PhaR [Ectothiorhodospira sp. PHS-1]|uniref:polyhydroxyalkanoate synthesis repressor PhaR n=1 Tax=Ectothiorhodospira sp. PHS-1 TaxID=519989 RepID=UPI00024A8496|nr:polyhydroxyalkanoate synthesis repressor PhaR [Ectothiorhodospira sp. PHS-1]EHQ51093.1 polyhydroxyalkonate synthesis repressor PhaR [Ectothiorhodospira sp. PHS-1]